MVTTLEEYNKELQDVHNDFIDKITNNITIRKPTHYCYQLDKPVYILVNNKEENAYIVDRGDHYEQTFPCYGFNPKQYKDDLAWILDDKTIFYIERPFKNRVIKLLRQLLPEHDIKTIKNDIIIDGIKIGPTCLAGPILDWSGENNPENSSLIYCLRWTDAEGLDKYLAGDTNHEKRKSSGIPLGSLDKFLTMSKEEFENMLESIE